VSSLPKLSAHPATFFRDTKESRTGLRQKGALDHKEIGCYTDCWIGSATVCGRELDHSVVAQA